MRKSVDTYQWNKIENCIFKIASRYFKEQFVNVINVVSLWEAYTVSSVKFHKVLCSFMQVLFYSEYFISNSLAPGKSECDSKNVIFNLVLLIGIFRSSHDNALWWMPQYLTDDKSTLVQVMAWCRQATSHYLSQCWPRSLLPYGVTRPQWVNLGQELKHNIKFILEKDAMHFKCN